MLKITGETIANWLFETKGNAINRD